MAEPDEVPDKDEFEKRVSALLEVNPKGLSGKHRREDDDDSSEPTTDE